MVLLGGVVAGPEGRSSDTRGHAAALWYPDVTSFCTMRNLWCIRGQMIVVSFSFAVFGVAHSTPAAVASLRGREVPTA